MISKIVLCSDQSKYSDITLQAGFLQFIFTHSSRLPQKYDKPGRLGTNLIPWLSLLNLLGWRGEENRQVSSSQ